MPHLLCTYLKVELGANTVSIFIYTLCSSFGLCFCLVLVSAITPKKTLCSWRTLTVTLETKKVRVHFNQIGNAIIEISKHCFTYFHSYCIHKKVKIEEIETNYLSIPKGGFQNMSVLPKEKPFPKFAYYTNKHKIQCRFLTCKLQVTIVSWPRT